ncbi:phage protein [Providencia rettgeri]
MSQRLSGQSFDFNIDGDLIHVEKVSLSITDNTAAAQTKGMPDGFVAGDVSAEGEIEISTKYFEIIVEKARAAGSWRGIKPMDFLWYAKAGNEEMKVESFGNKLILTDILDTDPKGGALTTHKIKYLVTSPDFVRIKGIPYLESELTQTLIG